MTFTTIGFYNDICTKHAHAHIYFVRLKLSMIGGTLDVLYHLGLETILKYNSKTASQYAFTYVYVVSIPKNKKFKMVHSI